MRLHRIEISAFGPFAGTVTVDLDALGADGLFLLHGETGAGKTTLLDAVAFALYGRVPGARGEAKRLRCDLADATTPTQVRLQATIGGRRMEIVRSPEYPRPKARGTGTTMQKAAVTLHWIDPPGNGLPASDLTRAEEVGQVVIDLLGMSADQFFQVVLLPQGDFARFLRADTAEREVLLEKLFDTGRFARLEEWFADRRRQARADLDGADSVVAQERARLCEAAGLTEWPTSPAALDPSAAAADGRTALPGASSTLEADPAGLAALHAALAERTRLAEVAAESARAGRTASAAALSAGKQRDAAVAKLIVLRAAQAELDAGAVAQQAGLEAIAAADRAAPVVVADATVRAAERAAVEAAQSVSSLRDVVPAEHRPELGVAGVHELDLDAALFSLTEDGAAHVADSDATLLAAAADRLRDQAGSLGALVGLADEQQRDRADEMRLAGDLTLVERDLAATDAALSRLPADRVAAEQHVAELRQLAGRLADCEAAVASATEVQRAAQAVPQLRSTLSAAQAACRTAVDAHQSARDQRQVLVERRIAGMAAELAGQLSDGDPCAVCGSAVHPSPAGPIDGQVDAGAVAAARDFESGAERARAQAESAVVEAQTALTVAIGSARGHDAAGARTLLGDAVVAQRAAGDARDKEPAAVTAVQELVGRQAALAELRTSAMARLEVLRTSLTALGRALAKRSDQLREAAAGFESVSARRDHLLAAAGSLDAWAQAADGRERARVALRTARQQRDKAVADAGFADLTAALAAARLDLPATREKVRQYQERALVVSAQLADPDLDVDGPTERVDVVGLQARVDAAGEQADAATSEAHEAQQRSERVFVAAQRLERAWVARAPLAEQASRLTALADVIAGRGQNARALSLRSYVLAAKLQQVAVVAGQRLARMSGGRYSFVHSDEREARGKSGGLGLDVLDAYSGLVRPTKTLSGGESFLASLALALGLADVVAAESGGRMLDTIFIDEGFGSLDSDALDLVMATLDELRAGGRVVGVVSHVDEMRQRIPTRLRVRKSADGSTVEMAAPGIG